MNWNVVTVEKSVVGINDEILIKESDAKDAK